jgi:hypothetical protein
MKGEQQIPARVTDISPPGRIRQGIPSLTVLGRAFPFAERMNQNLSAINSLKVKKAQ